MPYSKDWVNNASPDELRAMTKDGLVRIGQLDQTHQQRFVDEIKAEPAVAKLIQRFERAPTE